MRSFTISAIAATVLLFAQQVYAQSTTNMNALMGLAPIRALQNTTVGKVALTRNLTITGSIQEGAAQQPFDASFLGWDPNDRGTSAIFEL